MPTPHRFNRAQLESELEQYPWEAWFQLERWKERNSDLEAIINSAVAGNTFRAFHHMPHPPARTFRDWAIGAIDSRGLKSMQSVTSQSEYTDWLYRLGEDFRRFWKQEMRKEMDFGRSLKLLNLLAKRLCICREIQVEEFRRIVRFLEVPLDSYTIQAVANCDVINKRIPLSATMSFVEDLPTYEEFQRGIRQLAEGVGVPAIAFECLAWDAGHAK
jgi:hypothetical protein